MSLPPFTTSFSLRAAPALFALLAASLVCAPAAAQSLPLWEAGAGFTALRMPDYRGSEQSHNLVVPLPFLIYRGEVLRVTREGVRAQLLETRRVEFDLSASGSVPVDSDDNRARAGMPDLKPTLELGPQLRLHLYADEARGLDLQLRLPLRAALTWGGDAGLRHLGWMATPNLNLNLRSQLGGRPANFGLSLGVLVADRRLNGYFYNVPAEYAQAGRPQYAVRGGYGGWQAIASASQRINRMWVGAFLKYDDVGGAVFADSPLVTRRRNLAGGIGLAWVFAESATRVGRD